MLRPLMAALATLVLVVAIAHPAAAAPMPDECVLTGKVLTCETDHGSSGGGPVEPVGFQGDDEQATPTAVWTREVIEEPNVCSPGAGQLGVWYRYTLRTPTGEVLEQNDQCVPAAEAPEPPPPLPPPPPPTREELLDSAVVPTPAILADPSGRGLTGLESRFWAADSGPVTASVTLRGWTVEGALTADRWTWTTGDGGRYESSGPGSAEHPAARHVYESKDTWPVTLEVSWSGSYTVSGFGTSYTVDGLATEGSSTLDYDVIEVRGVIDEPQLAG